MFGFGKSEAERTFDALYGKGARREPAEPTAGQAVAVTQLPNFRYSFDDGEKFQGGFGPTKILFPDYWTLRIRSSQLFEQNHYARGLIRRLVTNEINVGLNLEASPEEAILGYPEDGLADWSEETENRFALWSADPRLCDQAEQQTFGALQATARREALINGDVLVVLRQDQRTQLPRVQLVSGNLVQTPLGYTPFGGTAPKIYYGVEKDSTGRHVAYHVRQDDGTTKRLPAYGEKSGRRLAWLLYGTDKRLDDVRGKPLLALIMQSLQEVDRYRDSTQRKALLNSLLAMFVTKTADKPGTRPITGGAVRRSIDTTTDASGQSTRKFRAAEQVPGWVIDEMQVGEEVKAFVANGATDGFGVFEEAILQSCGWTNEIPPEILTLAFSNNYSASQAAINEFKIYLNKVRTDFGDNFCQPLYREWLLAEVLAKRIDAPRLLDSWRDPSMFDVFGAWTACDWSGHIKPAVDMSKLVGGYRDMVQEGFITRARAARELTGTKYSKNVQKLTQENAELYEANRLLAELKAEEKGVPAPVDDPDAETTVDDQVDGKQQTAEQRLRVIPKTAS